jgi:hypothetical protein
MFKNIFKFSSFSHFSGIMWLALIVGLVFCFLRKIILNQVGTDGEWIICIYFGVIYALTINYFNNAKNGGENQKQL